MRVRLLLSLVLAATSGLTSSPAPAVDGVIREPISFTVTNSDRVASYTVNGTLIRPVAGCTQSVLVAVHGLSYGAWAWDFPIRPETYSVAEALAARGYALVTIDKLGYGSSAGDRAPDQPNGYMLTVEGYADMTVQIASQLRNGTYQATVPGAFQKVGLIGHSAGAEIVELTAVTSPDISVLIPTAYTHEPFVNNDWLLRSWVPDNIAAAQSDYVYFEGNPTQRAADMYDLPNADEDVVTWDTEHANLTPSGEIYSIGSQPSRFVLPAIRIPVLLVLGEKDTLFPGSFGESELLWFQGTDDKTLFVVPDAGHSFMLHRNAAVANDAIATWLDTRFPKC